MLTVEEIKNQIEERIKMADIEPQLDGKMLIGKEFDIRREIGISRRALISLMKWIESNEKPS